MPRLEEGRRGPKVRHVQLELKAFGYYADDIDGVFGPLTRQAVAAFQEEVERLTVSGVVDAETAAALAQALIVKERPGEAPGPVPAAPPAPCVPAVWSAFLELVDVVTRTPVLYGPGRGLFVDGAWVVTQGPGKLGSKGWRSQLGRTYPSFHCSSWTNFFLGWLLRYNERYTHAGNVPALFDLCEASEDLHSQPGAAQYRGYGPHCRPIESDGRTRARTGIGKVLDIEEIDAHRASLPTFLICAQSTRKGASWKWWHHTLLADGFKAADGSYSATRMRWIPIDRTWIGRHAGEHLFRGYGVVSEDGDYGAGRPLCRVGVET